MLFRPNKRQLLSLATKWGLQSRVMVLHKGRTMTLPLRRAMRVRNLDYIYVLSQIEELEKVMEVLRSKDGCPWDKEQTHESLLRYLVEESYEFCDAVASGDGNKVLEELGDLLLQVVFHCQIAKEEQSFDFNQCAKVIKDKLIFRHPHIFGKETAETSKDVHQIWKEQKKKEGNKDNSLLANFPPPLRIEKNVQKYKNGYISKEMDKNTYKRVLSLASSKENILDNIGELLVNVIVMGSLNDKNITYELQKATQIWEKALKN